MNLAEIVGQNIASRRKLLGLSQKELAINLDITQDALNRMEKGKIAPKMSRLEDLAEYLQCPVSLLFRNENTAHNERTAIISEILATLPEGAQDALVNIVAEIARGMMCCKK